MSLFRDELLEKIQRQIEIDQKYLFYPDEIGKDSQSFLFNSLSSSFSFPSSSTGELKYYAMTTDWFSGLLQNLRRAKKFIFLEFFSISPGIMWEEIFNVLRERKNQGVEVRVIYDNLVSFSKLPRHFSSLLNESGILCQPYYQKNRLMGMIHNRHLHRKIVVIDGEIAFTGGMNIGDEYLNLIKPYGIFKDIGVSITGSSVWNFTVMFLSFWNAITSLKEDYWKYYCPCHLKINKSKRFCAYGDNPLVKQRISEELFTSLIDSSLNSISCYTPYFLPPISLFRCLNSAKKRGVTIEVILPGIPDKKLIYFFTKIYAFFLAGKNVHIYFYRNGFIHGKLLLVDEEVACVGSVNLDYYSLHYNFEDALFIQDAKTIQAIKNDLEKVKKECFFLKKGDEPESF